MLSEVKSFHRFDGKRKAIVNIGTECFILDHDEESPPIKILGKLSEYEVCVTEEGFLLWEKGGKIVEKTNNWLNRDETTIAPIEVYRSSEDIRFVCDGGDREVVICDNPHYVKIE